MFKIQVNIRVATGREWQDVHPKGGPAYQFATYDEAYSNMRMCYPNSIVGTEVRIREV